MNMNPKSTEEAPPDAAPPEVKDFLDAADPALITALFHKGLERMAQAQKITLDLAAQQSAEVTGAIRHAFRMPAGAPGMFVFDIAGQMVGRYVETQKSLLDLMVEQSSAMVATTRDRGDSGSRIAGNLANALQQSVDRAVTAQKMMLDLAAQQTREVTEAVKQQTGISGTPAAAAADSVQMGMDILVDAQKDFLDIAAQPLKRSSAKA